MVEDSREKIHDSHHRISVKKNTRNIKKISHVPHEVGPGYMPGHKSYNAGDVALIPRLQRSVDGGAAGIALDDDKHFYFILEVFSNADWAISGKNENGEDFEIRGIAGSTVYHSFITAPAGMSFQIPAGVFVRYAPLRAGEF